MSPRLATILIGGLMLASRTALAAPPPPPDVPAAPDPEPEADTSEPESVVTVADDEPEPAAEPDPAPVDVAADSQEAETPPDEGVDEEAEAKPSPFKSEHLTIEGYIQPQYTYRVRRGARPRDQQEFGAQQTRAGLIFHGNVLPKWSYRAHIVVGSQITRVVTDVDAVDYEGDGASDNLVTRTALVPGLELEQLWVNYRPVAVSSSKGMEILELNLKLGQMRVPFSRQNRTQNNSLLFPRRNQAVTSFLVSSDLGGLVEAGFADKRVSLSGGVFNGTGLAVNRDNRRGPLWSAQLEVAPLGALGGYESALELNKKPRFAVGAGMLYSPYQLFNSAGDDTLTRARDLLLSGSAKFVMHGFYLQGEFIRRQVTDNLSSRPFLSTGAYGQLSYAIPAGKKLFIAPLGNFGWTASEQAVDPLNRYFTTDGLAFYLPNERQLDAVRVSLLYQGEWLVDEGESAQGGTLQVQLKF
ncbi:MAG: porin [Nannocystales bacterium]